MRNNPERVAWAVLLLAFLTFCVLITGIPLGIRSYVLNATRKQDTSIQVIEGTVLLQKTGGSAPIGVTASGGPAALSQGDEAIIDNTSWATLDLFDRSHVTLYSNTRVGLAETYVPRFGASKQPNRVTLDLTSGLMRVGVAMPGKRPTQFRVITPHTTITLEEGSYRIEVTNEGTQVTVDRGQARVGQDSVAMTIPQGTRSSVGLDGRPTEPVPAERNLIVNGDFLQPLTTGWLTPEPVGLGSSVKTPQRELIQTDGRNAVHFFRRAGDRGNHTEISIQQRLSQDVRDYTRLTISLDVQLNYQSLSGGGERSTEFPIIVRLDYKDRWGNDTFWTHGFYYQNDAGYFIGPDNWGQPSGEQIQQGVWYPYESGNLLELLGENRPAFITGLSVYASGWDYDCLVAEVQVAVE